jgi:hypothetical protein
VAEPGPVIETGSIGIDFASEVLHCVARLSGGGQVAASLSLSFGLSAWMKRFGLGLDETVDTILSLRTALLSVSGLDTASEPVPLRVADRVIFVLNLAVYLEGLLGRAARALGVSPGEAADAAVELLRSN